MPLYKDSYIKFLKRRVEDVPRLEEQGYEPVICYFNPNTSGLCFISLEGFMEKGNSEVDCCNFDSKIREGLGKFDSKNEIEKLLESGKNDSVETLLNRGKRA